MQISCQGQLSVESYFYTHIVEMVYGPLPLTLETVLIVQTSLIVGFNSTVWFLFLKRRNLRKKYYYYIASLLCIASFPLAVGYILLCIISKENEFHSRSTYRGFLLLPVFVDS